MFNDRLFTSAENRSRPPRRLIVLELIGHFEYISVNQRRIDGINYLHIRILYISVLYESIIVCDNCKIISTTAVKIVKVYKLLTLSKSERFVFLTSRNPLALPWLSERLPESSIIHSPIPKKKQTPKIRRGEPMSVEFQGGEEIKIPADRQL